MHYYKLTFKVAGLMCRKEILATLEAAPLLGLVPRGQLHAWLASAQQSGITDEILTLLQEGLNVPSQTLYRAGGWCSRETEDRCPES